MPKRPILVVTEKPSIARSLAPLLAQAYGPVGLINICMLGPLEFDYPRGRPYSDYPAILEPQFKERAWWKQHCGRLIQVGSNGQMDTLYTAKEQIRAYVRASDIICAVDPGHSSCIGFEGLLAWAGRKTQADESFPLLCLLDYAPDSIERALAKTLSGESFYTPGVSLASVWGRAKQYFDYNFNLNSLSILGRTLRAAGVFKEALLSKYALLCFYILTQHSPLSEGWLIQTMAKWQGSGKYPQQPIGSAASQSTIIESLVTLGLVNYVDRKLVLSESGKRLQQRLHPDCYDPDLPMRLHAWCEAGLPQSRQAMERYLKTLFGKQKRFLAKVEQAL